METFSEIFIHSVEHSLADTLYLIPILYLTYVLMEWIEHRAKKKTQELVTKAGAAGPVVGSILGAVPQCGFSAMGATLYAGRVITIGTLFAIFLSTSDEMLPIFIASKAPISMIASILLTKIVIGMLMGLLIDLTFRLADKKQDRFKIHEICERSHCGCINDCETCCENHELVYEHRDHDVDCKEIDCHHTHSHDDESWKNIFMSALKHTIQVYAFILLITFILTLIIEFIGEDTLAQVLVNNEYLSILISGLIGLIPNCAASIVISEMYIEGFIGAGPLLAGLLVSAGVGLLVLIQTNRNVKQNMLIIGGLYVTGIAFGFITSLLGIVF